MITVIVTRMRIQSFTGVKLLFELILSLLFKTDSIPIFVLLKYKQKELPKTAKFQQFARLLKKSSKKYFFEDFVYNITKV